MRDTDIGKGRGDYEGGERQGETGRDTDIGKGRGDYEGGERQ